MGGGDGEAEDGGEDDEGDEDRGVADPGPLVGDVAGAVARAGEEGPEEGCCGLCVVWWVRCGKTSVSEVLSLGYCNLSLSLSLTHTAKSRGERKEVFTETRWRGEGEIGGGGEG